MENCRYFVTQILVWIVDLICVARQRVAGPALAHIREPS